MPRKKIEFQPVSQIPEKFNFLPQNMKPTICCDVPSQRAFAVFLSRFLSYLTCKSKWVPLMEKLNF